MICCTYIKIQYKVFRMYLHANLSTSFGYIPAVIWERMWGQHQEREARERKRTEQFPGNMWKRMVLVACLLGSLDCFSWFSLLLFNGFLLLLLLLLLLLTTLLFFFFCCLLCVVGLLLIGCLLFVVDSLFIVFVVNPCGAGCDGLSN